MGRRWAKCEDRYLKEHYEDKSITVRQIADMLGRKEGAVAYRANSLGLYRGQKYNKRKFEEMRKNSAKECPPREVQDASYTNICASVLDGDSFEKIARGTNRPVEQVKEIYEAGVRKGRLDAIKRYRSDGYAAAKSRHYNIPKGFKCQGCKNG